jgi:hypothetical protein
MMGETLTIAAQSSNGKDTYRVDFLFDGNKMSVHCSCPAGRFHKFCKHKMSLLKGNDFYLADENDRENLKFVASWVQKSAYLDLIIKASKAQSALDEAEANLRAVHTEISAAMKTGLCSWEQ